VAEVRPGSWRWRLLVGEAMARLGAARLLIAAVPLRRWRHILGDGQGKPVGRQGASPAARVLAGAVERAAARLPFATKCLPRAIALHTMLRRRHLRSCLVIAVSDPRRRGEIEDLHAWVETDGETVIGKIDFPFHPLIRFS
jgi:hypothetical protein